MVISAAFLDHSFGVPGDEKYVHVGGHKIIFFRASMLTKIRGESLFEKCMLNVNPTLFSDPPTPTSKRQSIVGQW